MEINLKGRKVVLGKSPSTTPREPARQPQTEEAEKATERLLPRSGATGEPFNPRAWYSQSGRRSWAVTRGIEDETF